MLNTNINQFLARHRKITLNRSFTWWTVTSCPLGTCARQERLYPLGYGYLQFRYKVAIEDIHVSVGIFNPTFQLGLQLNVLKINY